MRSLIGIDIGTRFVKVVRFEQGKRLLIKQAFSFPVPLTDPENFSFDREAFARLLTEQISLPVIRNSRLAVNFSASLVSMLLVNLPKFRNQKEIETAVCAEAKRKMVPVPGPDSIFEYMILGESTATKIPRYEVMVAKSEKKHVDEILGLFSQFGDVYPELITPSYCTVPFLLPQEKNDLKKDTLFANIGYETLSISIVREDKVYLSRSVKFGLKDIIGHIGSTLARTSEQTMAIIDKAGVPEVDFDFSDKVKVAEEIMRQKYESSADTSGAEQVNLIELRMCWDTEIERVVHEIRRTLIFYKDQSQGRRVEKMFFYGGGAQIKGMTSALMKKLSGVHVEGVPLKSLGIHISGENELYVTENQLALTPAFSLAYYLHSVKAKTIINFLPLALKKKEATLRAQVTALIAGVIISAALFLGWITLLVNIGVYQREASWLEFEMTRAQRIIEDLNRFKQEQRELQQKKSMVEKVSGSIIYMPPLLAAVADSIPEEVVIEEMDMGNAVSAAAGQGGASPTGRFSAPQPAVTSPQSQTSLPGVTIKAYSHADYESTCAYALDFKQALEKSGKFRNVELVYPELEEISPVFKSEKDVSLTEKRDRFFSIKAEVVISE